MNKNSTLKHLTSMITKASLLVALGCVIHSFTIPESLEQSNKDLKFSLQIIKEQHIYIQTLEKVVKTNHNHVKRMQLIAGVDTLKDVFSYKMKVLNPIDQKNLLHYDLRIKQKK